jgi:hypothetical protein
VTASAAAPPACLLVSPFCGRSPASCLAPLGHSVRIRELTRAVDSDSRYSCCGECVLVMHGGVVSFLLEGRCMRLNVRTGVCSFVGSFS